MVLLRDRILLYEPGLIHPLNSYMDIYTDTRTDVRAELFVLRTVRPGTPGHPKRT